MLLTVQSLRGTLPIVTGFLFSRSNALSTISPWQRMSFSIHPCGVRAGNTDCGVQTVGARNVSALDLILSPLWNLSFRLPSGQLLYNHLSTFATIYEDWNATTTDIMESTRWPSLRTMLVPHFQIIDSYLTSERLPDHPTRPELGDVVYVDYPCSSSATLVDASNYTVICNMDANIRTVCSFSNSGVSCRSLSNL